MFQTVVSHGTDGQLKVRGLYIGDDSECFNLARSIIVESEFPDG